MVEQPRVVVRAAKRRLANLHDARVNEIGFECVAEFGAWVSEVGRGQCDVGQLECRNRSQPGVPVRRHLRVSGVEVRCRTSERGARGKGLPSAKIVDRDDEVVVDALTGANGGRIARERREARRWLRVQCCRTWCCCF